MTPRLALFACLIFIAWLFRRDMKCQRAGSWALLIPGIWLAVQGSRPVSYWLGSTSGGEGESSPMDALSFAVLIGAALVVLFKRQFDWGTFIGRNKALFLIYLYFAMSILWSEMPLVSLKRVFKDFGCVLVALVFLTQTDPAAAVRTVFVRVSYVLFPLSVVFGKYFPDIGRDFTTDGAAMFTGVTSQKNSLGEAVFVFGLVILWDLIETHKREYERGKKNQRLILVGLLSMGLWLLVECDSKTSLLCLILGGFIFWGCARLVRMRHGKGVLIACLAAGISLAVLDKTFGLSEIVIKALGRNPTLTGRTDIWRLVLEQKTDPVFGCGFMMFWDSDYGKAFAESLVRLNSAHNGYLEIYLDGGLLANALHGLLLLSVCGRVIGRLFSSSPFGAIGLIFWINAIVYNLSESSFFRLDVLWFTFLLVTIEYPQTQSQDAMVSAMEQENPLAAGCEKPCEGG